MMQHRKPKTEAEKESNRRYMREWRKKQRGKAKTETDESASTTLNDSERSSTAVQPLPQGNDSPRLSKGEAEEILDRLLRRGKTEAGKTKAGKTEGPNKRWKTHRLSSKPKKRSRQLNIGRIPARFIVTAFDEIYRAMHTRPLSETERAEGIEAFAAVVYYLGLTNPLVIAGMWVATTGGVRLMDKLEDRDRERKRLPAIDRSMARRPEAPVLEMVKVDGNGAPKTDAS